MMNMNVMASSRQDVGQTLFGAQHVSLSAHNADCENFDSVPLKVLIADDSAALRTRIVGFLAPLVGASEIGEAADVLGTISYLREHRVDMVILDLCLPDGSGFDVLDFLNTSSQRPVVAVFTNYGEPEVRALSLGRGADYFFDKSIEFEQLVDLVARHARHSTRPQAAHDKC